MGIGHNLAAETENDVRGGDIPDRFTPVVDGTVPSRIHGVYEGDAFVPAGPRQWTLVDTGTHDRFTPEGWKRRE